MPGPSKIPLNVRALRGTFKPSRDRASTRGFPALDAPPTPPHWLTGANAIAEWGRLAEVMLANKLLTPGNCSLLAHYCMLHDRAVNCWRGKGSPPAALVAQLRLLAGSLGLVAVNFGAQRGEKNPFHAFNDRQRDAK